MTKEEILQFPFKNSLDIQIRFNDIDMNGHVNNGIYHSFFDMGRVDYFSKVFREKTKEALVAQVNTTYVKSLFIEDKICIKNAVIRWGNSSFDMLQAVFRKQEEGDELVTFCVTTFVHIENGKPAPVPQCWKDGAARLGE